MKWPKFGFESITTLSTGRVSFGKLFGINVTFLGHFLNNFFAPNKIDYFREKYAVDGSVGSGGEYVVQVSSTFEKYT